MQEREKKREIPLELRLFYALSRNPNDRTQIGASSGEAAKVGMIADIMGRLWHAAGLSEVGGLVVPDRNRQKRLLLDAFSEDEIVELIGSLAVRENYLDRNLDLADPTSRARLVLDNEQDWLPGLPLRYHDALSKIASNQVMPPLPSAREIATTPFALIKKVTRKLFQSKK